VSWERGNESSGSIKSRVSGLSEDLSALQETVCIIRFFDSYCVSLNGA